MKIKSVWTFILSTFLILSLAGCSESDKFYGSSGGGGTGTNITLAASALPSTITVGTTTTLTALVTDDAGLPVSGATVTFFATNGTFGGTATTISATTDGNGQAAATLTGSIKVGSGTVDVTSGDQSTSLTITYVAGAVSQIFLQASPTSVGAGGSSTITAKVIDQYANPIEGVALFFDVSVASSGTDAAMEYGGLGAQPTDANGVTSTVYTPGTQASNVSDTVRARVFISTGTYGTVAGTTNISVLSSATTVSSLTLRLSSATPRITVADSTVTADVTVLDSTNSPMTGVPVAFYFLSGNGTFTGGVQSTTVQTDANGIASVGIVAPNVVGSAVIEASVATGLKQSANLEYVAADPSFVTVLASPNSVGINSSSSVTATLYDAYGNLVSGQEVTFTIADITTNPSATGDAILSNPLGIVYSNTSGVATLTYTSGVELGEDVITAKATKSTVTPQPSGTANIVVGAGSSTIGSVTLVPGNATVVADGVSFTVLRATVKDTSGAPMANITVNFTTSAGTFDTATPTTTLAATTGTDGVAQVNLTSSTTLATANVTASSGGFTGSDVVYFVAGPAAASNSSMTVSPATLPADGISTAVITVTLADANNNPVADGTSVQVLGIVSDAVITSANPAATAGGRVTFDLKAATTAATDSLYLSQNSAIATTVTYGSGGSTGLPASIQVSSDLSQIYVAGVGKAETATVTVTVVDGTGVPISNPIDGTGALYENVRVTLLTKPNGGEFISGADSTGAPVSNINTIDIMTTAGQVTFAVQSGILPGIVEIRLDVIDETGATLVPEVSAIVPQIVIASGPAHSITLTSPFTNSIQNLGGGVYKRIGTAIVADRYGNAVPDGTIVNFGVIDSVIAEGVSGSTTAAGSAMTDATASFTTDSIWRNGVWRFIQPNDRVLLLDASAEDKSRHIATAGVSSATALPVQKSYLKTASPLQYVTGASVLGAEIFGVDNNGTGLENPGYGTTKDGQTTFYVKYPANEQKIHVGCGISGYACSDSYYQTEGSLSGGDGCLGVDVVAPASESDNTWAQYRDERYTPNSSAEVYVVASTSEATTESAVTVDRGQFCFASIAGWSMGAIPSKLTSSGTVTLSLVDGGDLIPLPFKRLAPSVTIDNKAAGSCSDGASADAAACATAGGTWTPDTFAIDTTNLSCITDNPGEFIAGSAVSGTCVATVDIIGSGWVKGDKATITWYAGDASVSVLVEIP